jgi:hypothetical protein
MRLSHAVCLSIILPLISLAAPPTELSAQPFGTPGAFLDIPDADGYVEVPNDPSLTPAQAITIEFWGSTATQTGINSFIGKGSLTSYWIGSDHGKLRSILQGASTTSATGGVLPNDFAHIAVTYDGHLRKHYIDGELVGVFPHTGALVGNANPLRIGSDIDFPNHPFNDLFEVRLWSVARTQSQIRAFSTQRISTAMPGLVAVWHLDGNGNDAVGGHNGGPPQGFAQYVTLGTGPCGPQADRACFMNRFQGTVAWETFSPAGDGHLNLVNSGPGLVVPGASSNSALFYFFDPSNWELLVKMPAGTCILGNYWVFSAATTNVHYTLVVYDLTTGTMKRYFNYSGPPAAAVTDTAAFATCP